MATVAVFNKQEFEEELNGDSFRPLTPAEQVRWQRVRRKAKAKSAMKSRRRRLRKKSSS